MINSNDGDIVVVDLGGTSIRICYLQNGIPINEMQSLSSEILRVEDSYRVLADVIKKFIEKRDLCVVAVVLGIPAMLDKYGDNLSHCNNIPQLEGHGLNQTLSAILNCPVILEQDIMLQLLGEWRHGEAAGCPWVIGVYFGTGIGSAYLENGDPNKRNAASVQAGHIPIMAQGKPCVCGNTDCIEAYACGHTLVSLAEQYDCPIDSLFVQIENKRLAAELDQFIVFQAYMLATLVTLFLPDMILIGGGIPNMKGYPKDKLIQYTRGKLQQPYPSDSVCINWASLGSSAVLHGALALLDIHNSKLTTPGNQHGIAHRA